MLSSTSISRTAADRSVPPEAFLEKGVLEIYSKLTREQSNFIEIALWHGYFLVNLLHIFRTRFPKNTCGGAASEKKGEFDIIFIFMKLIASKFRQ